MIAAGIYAHLSQDIGVAALVGERIFPLIIPQARAASLLRQPCLVYARVGAQRQQKYCGTEGLVRSDFQLDCYAPSFDQSKDLAAATRAALIDFAGMMAQTRVIAVHLDDEGDLSEPEVGLYRVVQRFIVWHDESP
jgi:hypothetical protein